MRIYDVIINPRPSPPTFWATRPCAALGAIAVAMFQVSVIFFRPRWTRQGLSLFLAVTVCTIASLTLVDGTPRSITDPFDVSDAYTAGYVVLATTSVGMPVTGEHTWIVAVVPLIYLAVNAAWVAAAGISWVRLSPTWQA